MEQRHGSSKNKTVRHGDGNALENSMGLLTEEYFK